MGRISEGSVTSCAALHLSLPVTIPLCCNRIGSLLVVRKILSIVQNTTISFCCLNQDCYSSSFFVHTSQKNVLPQTFPPEWSLKSALWSEASVWSANTWGGVEGVFKYRLGQNMFKENLGSYPPLSTPPLPFLMLNLGSLQPCFNCVTSEQQKHTLLATDMRFKKRASDTRIHCLHEYVNSAFCGTLLVS